MHTDFDKILSRWICQKFFNRLRRACLSLSGMGKIIFLWKLFSHFEQSEILKWDSHLKISLPKWEKKISLRILTSPKWDENFWKKSHFAEVRWEFLKKISLRFFEMRFFEKNLTSIFRDEIFSSNSHFDFQNERKQFNSRII